MVTLALHRPSDPAQRGAQSIAGALGKPTSRPEGPRRLAGGLLGAVEAQPENLGSRLPPEILNAYLEDPRGVGVGHSVICAMSVRSPPSSFRQHHRDRVRPAPNVPLTTSTKSPRSARGSR
jgi:hypothetical protein